MNPFEFVIAIIAIVTIGNIIRTKQMAKYGIRGRRGLPDPLGLFGRRGRDGDDGDDLIAHDNGETRRLRDEVDQLKERIKVLERITVEKENSLAKEIESLRDR